MLDLKGCFGALSMPMFHIAKDAPQQEWIGSSSAKVFFKAL